MKLPAAGKSAEQYGPSESLYYRHCRLRTGQHLALCAAPLPIMKSFPDRFRFLPTALGWRRHGQPHALSRPCHAHLLSGTGESRYLGILFAIDVNNLLGNSLKRR